EAELDVRGGASKHVQQFRGQQDAVGGELVPAPVLVHVDEQPSQGGVDGRLAAAEVERLDPTGAQPVDAVDERGRVWSAVPLRRGEAEAAARVAVARDPDADRGGQAVHGGAHGRAPPGARSRSSASMLQKRAPCSMASSSATWVCGTSSNQRLGMVRLVLRRYSPPSMAIARVLMSSAEKLNGLRPTKRIRYQYTNRKSKAAG